MGLKSVVRCIASVLLAVSAGNLLGPGPTVTSSGVTSAGFDGVHDIVAGPEPGLVAVIAVAGSATQLVVLDMTDEGDSAHFETIAEMPLGGRPFGLLSTAVWLDSSRLLAAVVTDPGSYAVAVAEWDDAQLTATPLQLRFEQAWTFEGEGPPDLAFDPSRPDEVLVLLSRTVQRRALNDGELLDEVSFDLHPTALGACEDGTIAVLLADAGEPSELMRLSADLAEVTPIGGVLAEDAAASNAQFVAGCDGIFLRTWHVTGTADPVVELRSLANGSVVAAPDIGAGVRDVTLLVDGACLGYNVRSRDLESCESIDLPADW